MKTRLLNLYNTIRSSYWFVPSLLQIFVFVLAWLSISIDESALQSYFSKIPWMYAADADGARSVLSTIAASMISAASVTFSITLVALTMTSSQFGPRLLRNFMRDAVNQFVLGIFLGTFVYALLVLRTVSGVEGADFVPHLSISIAFMLAVFCAFVLIFYIHHISTSISADVVLAKVSAELEQRLHTFFKEAANDAVDDPRLSEVVEKVQTDGASFDALKTGYIQAIDYDGLLEKAEEFDLQVVLDVRARDYICDDAPIGNYLCRGESQEPDAVTKAINNCIVVGAQRTAEQDIEFAIHQLVEVALRALSPGINDPYTALACLDRLGSALYFALDHEEAPNRYYDEEETLRLYVDTVTHIGCIDAAFTQIRQFAASVPAVIFRMLEIIEVLALRAVTKEIQEALQRHLDGAYASCGEHLVDEGDRKDLEKRYKSASQAVSIQSERE